MNLKKVLILNLILISFISFNYAEEKGEKLFIHKQQWKELSKNYDYTETYKTPKPKQRKEPRFKSNIFPFFTSSWIAYVLAGIVIAALLLLIIFLIVSIYKESSKEKILKKEVIEGANIENIENIDLESILNKAIAEGLFKLAIRIRYLILLRTLNRLNLVVWKRDKTNGNYLNEMYGKKGFELFKRVTINFERIWYGEKDTDVTEYQKLTLLFEQVNNSVVSNE
jgi:hypothetical protein